MNYSNQLPHLINSLPEGVKGFTTTSYSIALEGWRRGLKLRFYNRKRGGKAITTAITYSLSDGVNEYDFMGARGPKSDKKAIDDAEHKSTAYTIMEKNGVPVPKFKEFNYETSSIEEMCEFGESIGYPLVVKPTDMGGGNGVFTNINTREDLIGALSTVKNEFNKDNEVMIEKYFEGGIDYRFYVIEKNVIAVSKNYSSNVIGDGSSNLEELIYERNKEIRISSSTRSRVIRIDDNMIDFLKESSKDLSYVPEKGERVFLREHGTYLGKRLAVACTESVPSKFKQYAVDALNSFPGLYSGSIDMIINEEKDEGIVNEINTRGEIQMHVLPLEGQAIDVPKYLLDYYFPGTKIINNNFHFEYKPIKEAFLAGYADEITVPMYPRNPQYSIKLDLKGKNMGPLYLNRVKREAASLHLKGQIKVISKKRIRLNLIGEKNKLNRFTQFIKDFSTSKSVIDEVGSTEMVDFKDKSTIALEVEIDRTPSIEKQYNNLKKKYNKFNKQYDLLKRQYNNLRKDKDKEILDLNDKNKQLLKDYDKHIKEYEKVKSSTSWRVTKPIRKIGSVVKKFRAK